MKVRSIRATKAILCFAGLLMLAVACAAWSGSPSNEESRSTAVLEIHLRDLGYQSMNEYHHIGAGIPRDLSLLNDDDKKGLLFTDEKTLAVYVSHFQSATDGSMGQGTRDMEAFFLDFHSGTLISRKTWPTIKRRWLNERWDTQARIMAVHGGFLVHAGNALVLYSADQEKKREFPLAVGSRWAAVVPPMGRTIHLQRIDRDETEGTWLDSDTLTKLRSQREIEGITSASDDAVVTKLAHCMQLQTFGKLPRNLCSDPCRLGLPEFLSDAEVLSVYRNGFSVLSASGEKLWTREVPDAKNRIVESHQRSLDGSRFALSLRGGRNTSFDGVKVPKGELAIVVYERSTRTEVFHVSIGRVAEPVAFALAPDGSTLAILVGEMLRVYKVSS